MDTIKDTIKIKKYISLMYSKDSELNSIQDLQERKITACKRSQLDTKDDMVQKIMDLQDIIVNEWIFEYLSRENPNEYLMLISDQQLFWDMQHEKMAQSETKDTDAEGRLKEFNLKTTLSLKSEELLDRIKKTYRLIYLGDKETDMAVDKVRKMTPEQRLKIKSA